MNVAADSHAAVTEWIRSPLGQQLWAVESTAAAQALEHVFGIQALQIGAWGGVPGLLEHCRTQRQALASPDPADGATICADPAQLPIAADCVDVVILPHTLETESRPHDVLREAERVLVGEGHLLVFGFNPYSLFGLRRLVSRGRFPARLRQLVSERRLRDWVSLLGFDVVSVQRHFYVFPLHYRLQLAAPVAGAYVLLARKRVYSLTPIRPRWRRSRRAVGGIVEPTTRSAVLID